MEEQPKALRLADELIEYVLPCSGSEHWDTLDAAAAELRSLHEVNQQLLKALKDSDKLIEQLMPGIKHICLQDYAFLNDTLLSNTKAIKAGEQL